MPAIGFGMGDVVLSNYISEHPAASAALNQWLEAHRGCDVAIVLVDEAQRPEALGVLQALRDQGFSVELPFQVTKVGKQFQTAEQSGARHAVVIGSEWPLVKLKHLATRTETQVPHSELAQSLRKGQEHGVPGRSAA
jgi:histidyl-tRNA synthetase